MNVALMQVVIASAINGAHCQNFRIDLCRCVNRARNRRAQNNEGKSYLQERSCLDNAGNVARATSSESGARHLPLCGEAQQEARAMCGHQAEPQVLKGERSDADAFLLILHKWIFNSFFLLCRTGCHTGFVVPATSC